MQPRRDRGAVGRAGAQRGLAAAQVPGERAQPVALGGQHDVVGAGRAHHPRDDVALLRGRGGEAVAQLAPARVHVHLAAGLRVHEPEVAGRDELLLARVADLHRHHAVAGAQRAHRALPVLRAGEVADDDHEPALAPERGPVAQRGAARGRALPVALGPAAQLGQQREQPEPALARAQHARVARAEGHDAEPVAAPRGHVADGKRHALGHVGLAPVGGAEGHRGRDVEHEPRGHRALAHVHAHVGLLQPRRGVPVDLAHVVAGEVGPDHGELRARADLRREVLARDEALDALHHREVERAQDRGRDGPGPGLGRAALGRRRGDPAPHGSLPPRTSPKPAPASSSTSAPPANADVTWRFSLTWARRVPSPAYTACSLRASGAAKNWPPLSRAMSCSVSASGGTFSVVTAPVLRSVWLSVPFAVPSATVKIGILYFLTSPTTSIGSAPRALAPSESSTPAAGSRRLPPSPSGTGTRAESTASFNASPIAVAPCTFSALMAAITRAWSVVGSASSCAAEPKLMSPSRNPSGTLFATVRAAAWAAASRVGRTSVAVIEPDVSVTSTTVASRRSAATVRCGRASAISSAARASSASSAGRWRVHERPAATEASRSTFV